MKVLQSVVAEYLDERPNAADILNDLLEQNGRDRIAQDGPPSQRLALVLDEVLSPQQAGRLACEFAEHVLSYTPEETQAAAKEALAAKRAFLTGRGELRDLVNLADRVLRQWEPENTQPARAAWAAWAAALARPSHAAASAQAVRDDELDWQLARLKADLQNAPP